MNKPLVLTLISSSISRIGKVTSRYNKCLKESIVLFFEDREIYFPFL